MASQVSRTYDYVYQHQKLHDWFAIRIETRDQPQGHQTKHVIFTSRLHVTKEIELTWCYDAEAWRDFEILNDASMVEKMRQHYGRDLTINDTLRSVGL